MPLYATHVSNVPDNETIKIVAGKLVVNLDDQSLQFVVADDNIQAFNCPIGGTIDWFKNIPGVPALMNNFVECNGQVLSDADSPMNGQTIPDLNGGNRFIRGNATSGATGAGTHFHQWYKNTGGGSYDIATATVHNAQSYSSDGTLKNIVSNNNVDYYTDPSAATPPFMNAVKVMRVK